MERRGWGKHGFWRKNSVHPSKCVGSTVILGGPEVLGSCEARSSLLQSPLICFWFTEKRHMDVSMDKYMIVLNDKLRLTNSVRTMTEV